MTGVAVGVRSREQAARPLRVGASDFFSGRRRYPDRGANGSGNSQDTADGLRYGRLSGHIPTAAAGAANGLLDRFSFDGNAGQAEILFTVRADIKILGIATAVMAYHVVVFGHRLPFSPSARPTGESMVGGGCPHGASVSPGGVSNSTGKNRDRSLSLPLQPGQDPMKTTYSALRAARVSSGSGLWV